MSESSSQDSKGRPRLTSPGGLNISNPDDPSGGYKVANLDQNKEFNVTGRTDKAGKEITLIKCRDVTVPAAPLTESTGTPTDAGKNFNFAGDPVVSVYGRRRYKATCEYNNDAAQTDYDNQDFAAVPGVLKVTFGTVTDNTCPQGTCTNAKDITYTLSWGVGPADAPWKWGFEIEDSGEYICDVYKCIVAVLTTCDDVGCLTVSIKPGFESVGAIARYQISNWDFLFPANSITLNRLSAAANQCNWPNNITVAADPP